jgi:hypothetical protein
MEAMNWASDKSKLNAAAYKVLANAKNLEKQRLDSGEWEYKTTRDENGKITTKLVKKNVNTKRRGRKS